MIHLSYLTDVIFVNILEELLALFKKLTISYTNFSGEQSLDKKIIDTDFFIWHQ